MLRAMLTSLGLSKQAPLPVVHSPFSKKFIRTMASKPDIALSKPLRLTTSCTYSTKTLAAKKQHGFFGHHNEERVKRWLINYYQGLHINTAQLKVTKLLVESGDRFMGFNSDQLINQHVIVYRPEALQTSIWKRIFSRAKNQGKHVGVLELSSAVTCYKVTLPGKLLSNQFSFFLIPHHLLNPLHSLNKTQKQTQDNRNHSSLRKSR